MAPPAKVLARWESVKQLHREGSGIARISRKLGVCSKTIARDFKALQLTSFTAVGDDELNRLVGNALVVNSRRHGSQRTTSWLLMKGLRVQRSRVILALETHNAIRRKRRKPKRRSFYEVGSH
jgi:hypothetical protein